MRQTRIGRWGKEAMGNTCAETLVCSEDLRCVRGTASHPRRQFPEPRPVALRGRPRGHPGGEGDEIVLGRGLGRRRLGGDCGRPTANGQDLGHGIGQGGAQGVPPGWKVETTGHILAHGGEKFKPKAHTTAHTSRFRCCFWAEMAVRRRPRKAKSGIFPRKTAAFELVGERGFEPLTFWSRTACQACFTCSDCCTMFENVAVSLAFPLIPVFRRQHETPRNPTDAFPHNRPHNSHTGVAEHTRSCAQGHAN